MDGMYIPCSLLHTTNNDPSVMLCKLYAASTSTNNAYRSVSSDLYAFVDVVGDCRIYIVLYFDWLYSNIYAVDPRFFVRFGWYDPSHTRSAVLF